MYEVAASHAAALGLGEFETDLLEMAGVEKNTNFSSRASSQDTGYCRSYRGSLAGLRLLTMNGELHQRTTLLKLQIDLSHLSLNAVLKNSFTPSPPVTLSQTGSSCRPTSSSKRKNEQHTRSRLMNSAIARMFAFVPGSPTA